MYHNATCNILFLYKGRKLETGHGLAKRRSQLLPNTQTLKKEGKSGLGSRLCWGLKLAWERSRKLWLLIHPSVYVCSFINLKVTPNKIYSRGWKTWQNNCIKKSNTGNAVRKIMMPAVEHPLAPNCPVYIPSSPSSSPASDYTTPPPSPTRSSSPLLWLSCFSRPKCDFNDAVVTGEWQLRPLPKEETIIHTAISNLQPVPHDEWDG